MDRPSRQRGVAAVILIALFSVILIGVLLSSLAGKSSQNQADEKSFPALAQAQAALIAYAASHPTLPGRLPCPDIDNDGLEDAPCGAAGANQLGRLPWKTLGIPDLRDGSGECLWYAVSGAFKSNPPNPGPVNSDTNGSFTIKDDQGHTIATNAIAVILAPGAALSTDDRTPLGATRCGGNVTAANYLDTANGINNALGATTGVFVVGLPSDTYNDRVAFISPAQFFPAVERRVAGEIKQLLSKYYAINSYYPDANDFADASHNCTQGTTRGRVPLSISLSCSSPSLADWPAALPAWFTADNWYLLTYYTRAPACSSLGPGCTDIGGLLIVSNGPSPTNNKQALVIVPGPSLPGVLPVQPSPCVSAANCLDGTNGDGDDIYTTQSPSPTFNDVVVIVSP